MCAHVCKFDFAEDELRLAEEDPSFLSIPPFSVVGQELKHKEQIKIGQKNPPEAEPVLANGCQGQLLHAEKGLATFSFSSPF